MADSTVTENISEKQDERLKFGTGKEAVYKCNKCEFVSKDVRKFAEHHIKHFETVSLGSIIKSESDESDDYSSNYVNVGGRVYKCNKCDFESKIVRDFAEHHSEHFKPLRMKKLKNRVAKKDGMYNCNKCDFQSTDVREFAEHHRKHFSTQSFDSYLPETRRSQMKPYGCHLCDRRFAYKYFLSDHIRTHTGERPFVCDVCSKSFTCKQSLDVHLALHSGNYRYECEVCQKKFLTYPYLASHRRIHDNNRPFQCQYCGNTYKHKKTLTIHVRDHTNERPYKCNVCSAAFTSTCKLTEHTRLHTQEKRFLCQFCGKAFRNSNKKKIHMMTHTGERPYKCTICPDKGFIQTMQLKLHMRTHHNLKIVIKNKTISQTTLILPSLKMYDSIEL